MDLEHHLRVPEHGVRLDERDPADVAGLDKAQGKALLDAATDRLGDLQERLYAEGRRALLVVLQGMDASGKDGAVKHVFAGMNAQGVAVTSFKRPEPHELAHDFLWRQTVALPARGRIAVFNRSHYEEVLVTRVHPELLAARSIDPARAGDPAFWARRLEDIAAWERHLARDGTRVVKCFLHISRDEQRARFEARAEAPEKHWKFDANDVLERRHWDAYRSAYEAALSATSTAAAPWYVVPADRKWFARTAIAAIVEHHLGAMDPRFPEPSDEERAAMLAALAELRAEA